MNWGSGKRSVQTERAILSLVLGQGLRRVAFGIAAGLAGALALSQVLRSQLYGVCADAIPPSWRRRRHAAVWR